MGSILQMRSDDLGKLLLRLAVGGLMLFHGWFKVVHGVGWIAGMLGSAGFLAAGVYIGEIVAPLLIIAGVRTRLAVLIVAFDMLVAFWLVLRPHIFAINEMGGGLRVELEVLFLFGSLALFFMGGGKYGLTRGKSNWD